MYLGLSSNRLSHAYNYRGLTANQWLRGGVWVDTLLQQMSAMLNSNKQFEMDDSFQLSFTHVRVPPTGSGHKPKLKPGHSAFTSLKKKRLSVLLIKNRDELCCARAIVMAKARLDQHPNWDGFKRGRRIQAEHAVDLHHKTRVPEVHVGTMNSEPSLLLLLSTTIKFFSAMPRVGMS